MKKNELPSSKRIDLSSKIVQYNKDTSHHTDSLWTQLATQESVNQRAPKQPF